MEGLGSGEVWFQDLGKLRACAAPACLAGKGWRGSEDFGYSRRSFGQTRRTDCKTQGCRVFTSVCLMCGPRVRLECEVHGFT